METLETRIKAFLNIISGDGYGSGDGSGDGYGSGDGSGDGSGYGSGDGYGSGSGYGYGYGYGDGYGSGDGDGYGYGDGSGDGYGYGIKNLNGDKVYVIDDVPTIIKSVRDNIAQGFILNRDLTLRPCYIVKEQNHFAHGDTLHDAFTSLQEKLYDDSTEEERIEAFRKKFPAYDTPYPNRDLFAYHHVLTGSCRMGRESFCKDKGINLNDSTTVRQFVLLTKDSYGSVTIRKLPQAYGINES
nr:MAG TPA: hypothetical protein [Caudoviricetes sp.]